MNDISYWVTGAAMIFSSVGFWTFIQNWYNKRREEKAKDKMSLERQAIMCVLFMAIKMSCKACLHRGWVSTEEIEDIEKYMFEPYESMGGNGTAKMLMDRVKKLPSRPSSEHNIEDDRYYPLEEVEDNGNY